jgi:DNA polymerase III epsilon subunit-like protein
MLAVARSRHGFDTDQSTAVFRRALAQADTTGPAPTPSQWATFVDARIEELALDPAVSDTDFNTLARSLHATKSNVPDARTFAALEDFDSLAASAERALARQVDAAAALRGTSPSEAAERFQAFRRQYKTMFSKVRVSDRPTPPPAWVTGFTTRDRMSLAVPHDGATLFALYRCQADPAAFASATGSFASVDLETAGPNGKEGFDPENGSIIEVGIVTFAADGTKTDQYEQLVKPSPEVAARCQTGAVKVHGITMADVQDAPTWDQVSLTVASKLQGSTMLAHNASFEDEWLSHHLSQQGHRYGGAPVVDTMCVARQHLGDLPSHRLADVANELGVTYSNGHRALHDAEVAAAAFFALRKRMVADYEADSVRASLPQPARPFQRLTVPTPTAA